MTSLIEGKRIAGLTAGFTPYHHARWQAFAQKSQASCFVVELTNKDEFPVMECSHVAGSSFSRTTLFPRQLESHLSAAAINQSIARTLDQQRPACVCLNGYASPLALGALHWCLRNRVPAVMMSESTVWDELRKPWKEWLKSRVIRLCSSALVGGSPHADYMALLGMPRERIFPGYDAVDNDYFDLGSKRTRSREFEVRKTHGLPEKYFLAGARFIQKKNLSGLLQAYAQYRQLAVALVPASSDVAPWDLVIVGDGGGREALVTLCSKLGVEKNIHLVGAKPYDELPIYYGMASAFIHASTTEQWGLVVNEAMASGLPVLVSNRCGCSRDLVQDGVNGFTFNPYNVDDMTQKMFQLTTSSAQLSAFGNASREIIAKWSLQRFADGLSQAVKVALSAPPPRSTWFDWLLIGILMRR